MRRLRSLVAARRSAEYPIGRSVAKFALTGLIAFALAAVVGAYALNRLARDEAIRGAERITQTIANTVIEPNLRPELLQGDPEAIREMDELVRARVLRDSVVRVKLWSPDGQIVYSDETRLIGSQYSLDSEHEDILWNGVVASEVSELDEPENRFEPQGSPLLEVYLPLNGPGEEPLLLETYQRFESILSEGHRIWGLLSVALLGALLLLFLLQLPLAWGMARRLKQGQVEREALLRRAIEASVRERHRIAANLHDGVVQRLAGLSYSLSAASEGSDVPPGVRKKLTTAASDTRSTIRELRSLLVALYPPNLHATGLEAALTDLVEPLSTHGIQANLDLPPRLRLDRDTEAVLFRAAREALNNVMAHAHAQNVDIRIKTHDHRVSLTVEDDGRGFATDDLPQRRAEGHLGLTLLHELADEAGGSVMVRSNPGGGTSIGVEVPAP